jgi:hypothetical protein
MTLEFFAPEDVIIRQGSYSDTMYINVEGNLEVRPIYRTHLLPLLVLLTVRTTWIAREMLHTELTQLPPIFSNAVPALLRYHIGSISPSNCTAVCVATKDMTSLSKSPLTVQCRRYDHERHVGITMPRLTRPMNRNASRSTLNLDVLSLWKQDEDRTAPTDEHGRYTVVLVLGARRAFGEHAFFTGEAPPLERTRTRKGVGWNWIGVADKQHFVSCRA